MKMLLGANWVDRDERIAVLHPFDNSTVDSVPRATVADVETAIVAAQRGAVAMRRLTGYQRFEILDRVADLMRSHADDLARTISLEEGKILAEGRTEVERATEIIVLSAEEAKRLGGEVVPLDGAPGVSGKLGFTQRVPCGVVVAISPFNFPLHLVCHKIGPALAAGNACILKPASDTPLSALKIVELFQEAGTPAEALQCLTGSGGSLGEALCSDSRVRKITFTGSRDVGERITRVAGLKRVTMELGSNSPLIVMPDADPEIVARTAVGTSFANAGQACISTQRIIAHRDVYADLVSALGAATAPLKVGNPLEAGTDVGPMVREADAVRVGEWVREATDGGARLVVGGERSGALHSPTVVADVDPKMRISCDEVFGPVVAVTATTGLDEAIAMANDTNYGLSAAIFTRDIDTAMKFVRECEAGNLHVNWGTQWRADMMPYGGLKESGFGKEGPHYAVQEMTELKMTVFHTQG
jgi:acyl-CoA reductase-like NAD-dependent aldehyde dehydrogenase